MFSKYSASTASRATRRSGRRRRQTAVRGLLRRPAFRALLAARLAAALATAAAPLLLAFTVLDISGSAATLGLLLAARSAPQVLLLLAGGVVADRFPRRRVVLAATAVSVLTQAGIAAMLFAGPGSLALLAVLEAVAGAASAFLFPASEALTPQTVPPDRLREANAVLRIGANLAFTGGAAVAGVLIAAVDLAWGFAGSAAAYALAWACLARMRVAPATATPGPSLVADLRAGWREFARRRWLWVVVAEAFVVNAALAGAWMTLGPVIAQDTVGRAGWGLVAAALTVGMVLGGVLALRLRVPRMLGLGVAATLLVAPALLVLGLAPGLAALMAAALLAGVGSEVFEVAWQVSLQENVPDGTLSRVYSFDLLGSLAAVPLGQALAGHAADMTSPRATATVAALAAGAAALAALAVPDVRRLERRDVTPPPGQPADRPAWVAPEARAAGAPAPLIVADPRTRVEL
ncbi:MFS transporter [Motilibacter aurantiacus]|uniref:MFS transporter n=1 Tax=Motilibacter aurantiacus TaxID=2714955 RepID=UPI00140BFF99|nr:MFS transporter [Motilibacter aurantiacus]NHC44704.1 MFS transporter [Motilibacter aurantiacus]